MFFVDEPYISDLLKTTLRDNAIPVVATQVAKNTRVASRNELDQRVPGGGTGA